MFFYDFIVMYFNTDDFDLIDETMKEIKIILIRDLNICINWIYELIAHPDYTNQSELYRWGKENNNGNLPLIIFDNLLNGGGLTGTGSIKSNKCIILSDMCYNKKNQKEKILKITLHEIGHALGSNHYNDTESIMNSEGNQNNIKFDAKSHDQIQTYLNSD